MDSEVFDDALNDVVDKKIKTITQIKIPNIINSICLMFFIFLTMFKFAIFLEMSLMEYNFLLAYVYA